MTDRLQASLSIRDIRTTLFILLLVIPALLIGLAAVQPWIEPSHLTRDPLAVAAYLSNEGQACCSRYLGALSTVGIILWSATASACILSALVISVLAAPRMQRWFLGLAGGLSLWLVLDDAFMLHEGYSPKLFDMVDLFHFIPMVIMLPVLGAMWISHRPGGLAILIAALALLATSLGIDSFVEQSDDMIFIEDAFKLMGISFWAVFFVTKCVELVAEAAHHVDDVELPVGRNPILG